MKPMKVIIISSYILLLLTAFIPAIHSQQGKDSVPPLDPNLSTYSIEDLSKLAKKNEDNPKEAMFYEEMLRRGLQQNSTPVIHKALIGLLDHYCFAFDLENLDRWVHYTDSFLIIHKDESNLYYDAHNSRANLLLELKEYEPSINETIELYNKAEKNNHNYGMACSLEVLGKIYLSCQQDSTALETFQNAYSRLKKTGNNYSFQGRIMSCMLECNIRLNNLEALPGLLQEFEELVDLRDKERLAEGITPNIDWYRWQLQSFYADYYLRKGEMDKALEYLDKSSKFYQDGMPADYEFSVYYYLFVKASYFKKTKRYAQALATVDYILKDFSEPPCLKLKIDILSEMGEYKEALAMCNVLYKEMKNTNNEILVRKVNNLQVLYDKNNQQLQQRELQLVNLQVDSRRHMIIYTLLASIIALILIGILARFLRRTSRLKRELEVDKTALISSQEMLKTEQHKAEKADQMKDAFIASISHEIRTPLNTIVGFSTLLSEMQLEEEEKKEFVELIEKNSSLLLDLVNDVLDLSRLESGRTKITVAPCELTLCCQKLLAGTEELLMPNVRLIFSPSVSPFILRTDSRLLSQLLDNLLSNAAKFTKQGEINFAYEVDEIKRQVTFSVTDTGPGIPEDKQRIIFERFEKLNEYSQGSGLGLALCQAIAQRLGGIIRIDTTYTSGARFVFIHPYDTPVTSISQQN